MLLSLKVEYDSTIKTYFWYFWTIEKEKTWESTSNLKLLGVYKWTPAYLCIFNLSLIDLST